METEDPTKQPTATLKLSDANVSLWRGVTLHGAPQQSRTGDRMIIDNVKGAQDDVWITGSGAEQTLQRLVMRGEVTSKIGYGFTDIDAKTQERMLTVYRMFDAQ
jgi:hypothetical protein